MASIKPGDTAEVKSVLSAQIGEPVLLMEKEYDVIDGGKSMRMTVAVPNYKVYNLAGIRKVIQTLQAQLAEAQDLEARMVAAGIQEGAQVVELPQP
jgi:hypothetical protein